MQGTLHVLYLTKNTALSILKNTTFCIFQFHECLYYSPHDALRVCVCVMYHGTCHVCCKIYCTAFVTIILLNSSVCSFTMELYGQQTENTAPSPCHLHKFWHSLDVVLLDVPIVVSKRVSTFSVHSCAV
jgi:hypothetical protein